MLSNAFPSVAVSASSERMVQVLKMGRVPGTVVEAPKSASKSARLSVDVSGLKVQLRLSDVMRSSPQPPSSQLSAQHVQQWKKGKLKTVSSATSREQRTRGGKLPQQGLPSLSM
jgi:Fe2+ transport system protein FeoA